MKKALCIIIAVVIVLAGLFFWQRNNIEALYLFITKDSDGVNEYIEENQRKLEKEIKEYTEYLPRTLTPEEEERIAKGEMSVEEATEMLIGETEEIEKTDVENVTETKTEPADIPVKNEEKVTENKPSGASVSDIIKKYTANFYSLKAYYIGQLNQVEASARSEYSAMSAEEKKNLSKATFVGKYMGYATALQSECDSKVEGLLSDMKKELVAAGGDTKIIETIRKAYSDEKAARKAHYMNMVK